MFWVKTRQILYLSWCEEILELADSLYPPAILRQDNIPSVGQISAGLTQPGEPTFTFSWVCKPVPYTVSDKGCI